MTNKEIEARVKELLCEAEEDFSETEQFIEEHTEDYDGDLEEFAFRTAVQEGLYDYVSEHIDDVELNDEDGHSSYLDETEDEVIRQLLFDSGAYADLEDYSDCRFALNTNTWDIINFDTDLQEEAFERYLESYELSREEVIQALTNGEDLEKEGYDRDLENDLALLGITWKDGKLNFEDMTYECGMETVDLLEELGYENKFEGESWKLETVGVYYIE